MDESRGGQAEAFFHKAPTFSGGISYPLGFVNRFIHSFVCFLLYCLLARFGERFRSDPIGSGAPGRCPYRLFGLFLHTQRISLIRTSQEA